MPQQSRYNMTGSGIGQTVGRYGLGAFGGLVGGLPGAWIGSKIGGPLGGLVGGGLSSLFGPHGLGALGNSIQGATPLRGISMLVGNRGVGGAPLSYSGPNNLFGANVPAPAAGGMAAAPATVQAPQGVGYTGLGVSNYGQIAKGLPSFARANQQAMLSRNII